MALTIRSAALFYRGATENIGYGDIVPYLDGVEATGHSTIIGNGNLGTAQEVVYGTGDSHLADGRINDILHEISGAGLSEYGIFGDIVLAPRRDIVHLVGEVPYSAGSVEQLQEISGTGTSEAIAGFGRIKPNKCVVSSVGNSAYVACSGQVIYVPPVERIQGSGYTGQDIGAGDVRGRRHDVAGVGTSLWTLLITGDGVVTPNIDILEGIGTSDYIESIEGYGEVTGRRHAILSNGYLHVSGDGDVKQPAVTIRGKGSVQSVHGTIGFSRDNVIQGSSQAPAQIPLGHNRDPATAGGQQAQQAITPLSFSR